MFNAAPADALAASLSVHAGLDQVSTEARSLFESMYPLIRSIAEQHLRHERRDHTLQPTALANEAYLRLTATGQRWSDPREFLAAVAVTIRRVLIDHARARNAAKRDAGNLRGLWPIAPPKPLAVDQLTDIDAAVARLQSVDPRRAEVAVLKLFIGLSNDEIAETLNVARSTVAADWALARAWLARALSEAADAAQP
jgi:RNA polymerase sigma-70 factor, ECF subfamily